MGKDSITTQNQANSIPKIGDIWYARLCIMTPIFLCFSYIPGLNFGGMSGFNAKVSLGEMFIMLFTIGFLVFLFTYQREYVLNRLKVHTKLILLPTLYIFYELITLPFGANLIRGIFEAGVLICFFLIFFWGVIALPNTPASQKTVKFMVYVTLALSILTISEVVSGAFSDLGLCRGCVSAGFGFARPSVFAIEPQFLGSLLIIPVLYLVYIFSKNKSNRYEMISLFLSLIALFCTLSRGAVYATILGMLVLFISLKFEGFLKVLSVCIVCFLFSVALDMFAVAINNNIDSNPLNTPATIVSQYSLGLIELPRFINDLDLISSEEETSTENVNEQLEQALITPAFDRYVEQSTDERNTSTSNALTVWRSSAKNVLFGVGIGSAGQAVVNAGLNNSPYEIIQNQYISTLLELGLVGLAMFLSMIVALYFMFIRRRQYLYMSILTAFLIQWWFFSGLPNALHIYFALPLLAIWSNRDGLTYRPLAKPELKN